MKKELFLIASAAALFAACVNTEILRDYDIPQESENDGAILFTSFADNVTKGTAENSEALYTWTFYNHQDSFQVWGRKYEQYSHEIFNGTTVKVERTGSDPDYTYTYTYSPARFWDKAATKYHFYAAAPAQPTGDDPEWEWEFISEGINSSANLDKGYFKTTSVLNGVNLKHNDNLGTNNTRDTLYNIFKGTNDIDKLIAAPCEVTKTYYNRATPPAVNLNFIHILSKLNVTISTSLYDANHDYVVELLAFEIHNMPNAGNFDESRAFIETKKAMRWELDDPGTTTKILTGIDDTDDGKVVVTLPTAAQAAAHRPGAKQYIVESLIVPQEIKYERVALDSLAHDAVDGDTTYFANWEDYTKSLPIEALTKAQFDSLYVIDGENYTVKTLAQYQALDGKSGTTKEQFDVLLAKIAKTMNPAIPAYDLPTEPFFTIKYSIDGDIFTQNFNLAAAFKNYTNNEIVSGDGALTDAQKKFPFYEGWQNTLNIIINPTAIEFTADVAEWSPTTLEEYEIEQGNVNP